MASKSPLITIIWSYLDMAADMQPVSVPHHTAITLTLHCSRSRRVQVCSMCVETSLEELVL